jgi:hypothetical protein
MRKLSDSSRIWSARADLGGGISLAAGLVSLDVATVSTTAVEDREPYPTGSQGAAVN